MLEYDIQIIQYGTSWYIRQFNEKSVMSDFIKCFTCIKSWDKYCAAMLHEAVIVCCILKTALTSETFLKPNCKGWLCKIH